MNRSKEQVLVHDPGLTACISVSLISHCTPSISADISIGQALWTGVFMCGAYFNLWPWLVQKWNDWQERSSGTTQSRDSASADQNGRATQAGRQSPGSVSTNRSDRMSSTSGTVFRTASGRTMIDTAVNQNELGHLSNGALRMRSVIQVDV